MKIRPARQKFCSFPGCNGASCHYCGMRRLDDGQELFLRNLSELDAGALNDLADATFDSRAADEDDYARFALFVHFGFASTVVNGRRWNVVWSLTERGREALRRISFADDGEKR